MKENFQIKWNNAINNDTAIEKEKQKQERKRRRRKQKLHQPKEET